jgi:acyl CoA:acetate/3-ketoacid CoA transferase beta subunit
MEHTTKDGRPKLVERCGYPLTAPRAVLRVFTNLAVVDVVAGRGFVVREITPGMSLAELQAQTAATETAATESRNTTASLVTRPLARAHSTASATAT